MKESILKFCEQFLYEPKIINGGRLSRKDKYIIVGMGGSHLAADVARIFRPALNLKVHMNYGLPNTEESLLKEYLIILSSYSGNTEEVIDAFHKAIEQKLHTAVITVGGTLLELAKKYKVPYIQLPDTGIQPRMAVGFSLKAFLKIIGDEKALKEISQLTDVLQTSGLEKQGMALAKKLKGFVPIIYSSDANRSLADNWKIKCNETGKIPAFYNIFPELNHNEMTGFDVIESTKTLSSQFYFIFLKDNADHPRIVKRMNILEKLYIERGFCVDSINISHENVFCKIFSTLLLADWTMYYIAKEYGTEPELVPMVEEFKKLMII